MAIFIDDSGWGCLLSGVLIGGFNTNTGRFKCKMIPISYFQGRKFSKALYRDQALKAFLNIYDKIGESKEFIVCRGTVLDNVYEYLDKIGKVVERREVKEPLQSWLENEFAKSLVKIGVPRKTDGAHCLSFDEQLEWIKENPQRVRHVKTGWNSWQKKYSEILG